MGVIDNTITATIGDAATVTAGGLVSVVATDGAAVSVVGGQVAIGGTAGIGAALVNATILDSDTASISGLANVQGTGGVLVDAENSEQVSIFALGGAVGGTARVSGSATVTIIDDSTTATIGSAAASVPTAPRVQGGTGSGTSGTVTVEANNAFTLLGTAGALAIGGTAGVGIGADVGVVTLLTEASIATDASVAANGDVVVQAATTEQILSLSVTGAGGGDVGVGASAGVSTLNLTTKAWVAGGAVVNARNNVVVSAEDDTTDTQVAGNITVGGTVGVGVAAAIGVLTKDTEAWLGAGAVVTARALGGTIVANTGDVASGTGQDPQSAGQNIVFATSDVAADGTITAAQNGLSQGERVIYAGHGRPLGGLRQDGVYYVIAVDANHFKLAATATDAQAGHAILVNPATASLAIPTPSNATATSARPPSNRVRSTAPAW